MHMHIIHRELMSVFVFPVACNTTLIMSHRGAVYIKGLDQVAASDSISQGTVQTLIRVAGFHRGDGGTHCVWPLAQNGDILLLGKLWGVIVLINNMNIDGG